MGITIVAIGISTVVMDVDNSYVMMGVDDVIMPISTILFFKCA
jgi:hypothetical protein